MLLRSGASTPFPFDMPPRARFQSSRFYWFLGSHLGSADQPRISSWWGWPVERKRKPWWCESTTFRIGGRGSLGLCAQTMWRFPIFIIRISRLLNETKTSQFGHHLKIALKVDRKYHTNWKDSDDCQVHNDVSLEPQILKKRFIKVNLNSYTAKKRNFLTTCNASFPHRSKMSSSPRVKVEANQRPKLVSSFIE